MAFSYTGSALNSLVDGLTNNAAPVVTCLNDVKTWLNGANVDDTNLVSPNNVTYKQIVSMSGGATSALIGTTYVLAELASLPGTILLPASNGAACGISYLDPADYAVGGKTTKYRLRMYLGTNATAPLSTFTFGLYPVTAIGGGAGVTTITLGAVTAGSTCAFVAPGASTLATPVASGDFTAPTAGHYVVGVAVTVAGQAANSAVTWRAVLQQRAV